MKKVLYTLLFLVLGVSGYVLFSENSKTKISKSIVASASKDSFQRKILVQAINKLRKDPSSTHMKIITSIEDGEIYRAINYLKNAYSKDSVQRSARGLALANLHLYNGDYEPAIKEYTEILLDNNASLDALNNRAYCYNKLGKKVNELDDYNSILDLQPSNKIARKNRAQLNDELGNPYEAIDDLNILIENAGELNLSELLIMRAQSYSAIGVFDDATDDIEKSIELDGGNATSYISMAGNMTRLQQFEGALEYYNMAVELEPKNYNHYYARGLNYAFMNNKAKAIDDFTYTLNLSPNYVPALQNRAVTYQAIGDKESAMADVNRILSINPTYQNAISFKQYLSEGSR